MSLLHELRAIAEGQGNFIGNTEDNILTINELAEMFPLDEAYFGKKPVIKIQRAMDKLYDAVMANPNVVLQGSAESKALEQACCQVFGFKSCSIYWARREGLMMPMFDIRKMPDELPVPGDKDPCTLPRAIILRPFDKDFQYGSFKDGFYDKEHVLNVCINMDQTLFTIGKLTSEEAVAIILHEIGHNFDHSLWSFCKGWAKIAKLLMDISDGLPPEVIKQKVAKIAFGTIFSHIPKAAYYVTNIDDIINNMIPPIGMIVRLVGKIQFNIVKVIDIIFRAKDFVYLPKTIMMAPIQYLKHTFLRKGETYADSFAASYGYTTELVSALEKLQRYIYGDHTSDTPILNIMYDIGNLYAEISNLCYGGHGTNQQRSLRMMAKLRKDIKDAGLTTEDASAIHQELQRLEEFHKRYINMDDDRRKTLTGMFRKLMDAWMNGKNYKFTGNFIETEQYAE